MDNSMHGKKIKEIWYSDSENAFNECVRNLELSATYHGDRDEFWAVKKNEQGIEIERYNLKFVSSIMWDSQ